MWVHCSNEWLGDICFFIPLVTHGYWSGKYQINSIFSHHLFFIKALNSIFFGVFYTSQGCCYHSNEELKCRMSSSGSHSFSTWQRAFFLKDCETIRRWGLVGGSSLFPWSEPLNVITNCSFLHSLCFLIHCDANILCLPDVNCSPMSSLPWRNETPRRCKPKQVLPP